MSFNIFGPAEKNSIKVGYISTDRGFVEDVSVCEANDYAKLNPGTQFVFKNRKYIKFLNINEVNKLTPNDLLAGINTCEGVQLTSECPPPEVYFYGGGGVGVQGNPVFGSDGALLAVDLVSGGFGYQYPPIVEVKDGCGIGVGAVTRAILGEIVDTVEVYDQEEDFEEYEICEPTDPGYGNRYGPDGELLGEWDPATYTNLTQDPIRREILLYQDFLQKKTNPWWSTRKSYAPSKLTSSTKTTRTKFDVTDASYLEKQRAAGAINPVAWNEFMNTYAISPVPPSNVKGSDFAGIPFTFEWEEDFPYDGEYIFRGLCDNKVEFYLDNLKVSDLGGFNQGVTPIRKTLKAGVHRIRLDLLNIPIYETKKTQDQSPTSQTKKVFNTIDYIDKADRRLWRTNVYNGGGFINEYGVCPFDTTSQLEDNPYAGTHRIIWNNINFPIDGNYIIEIEVDDNVNLTFTGSGTETVINKRGFSGADQSTGKSTETKFFKAGNYTITADLEQIPGGKFGFSGIKGTNPMALAINVQTSFTETQVISAKSWNENPMGVAFTIDAPQPPIPQEPIRLQEGRCPNNPIWTTRFPGAKERWWPVILDSRWSRFMNRYAISPVPPLSENNSESSGVVWRNSWNLDIPYDGFYALKGTIDNAGRILIDGNEISKLNGFKNETPDSKKFFLSKGRHEIQVEVENYRQEIFELIDKKVFRTLDWISAAKIPPTPPIQTVDVQFNAFVGGDYANTFTIDELGINVSKGRGGEGNSQSFTKTVQTGKVYAVKLYSNPGTIKLRTQGDNILQAEDSTDYNWQDIGCSASIGRFFDLNGSECKFVVDAGPLNLTPIVSSGTAIDGVTYTGPELASYRSGFISPAYFDGTGREVMGKTFIMRWSNVDFFDDGQYTLYAEADDVLIVRIDGVEVGRAKVFEGQRVTNFNITKGKRTVELELTNIPGNARSTFEDNPVVGAVTITKKVSVGTGMTRPWTANPIGISAILIPPPCPRRMRGKGVVTDVIVDDPGNGYPGPAKDGYPAALRLKAVEVEDPGINYNCGVDQIQITPSNGAVLDYVCDSFGRIVEVKVLNPGLGFTAYPEITIQTETGINATFRPQFEVVRDPIVTNITDTQKLIQVTDLVGLKQTGYVDGRAYYGSVFYKEGIRYAGFYETPGDLVQIYDTLKESITARVTTPASAILRQGTDITSNDPRLNIPGTPQNLI
jgi:hypothetical protein